MNIRLLTSADWHLKRAGWASRPAIFGDSWFGLSQIVSAAVQARVPLIAAGDQFDSQQPDPATVKVAFEQIDRLREQSLPFLFVSGNHEKCRFSQWLGIHPHATCLDRCDYVLNNNDFRLYGLDYTPAAGLAEAFSGISRGANVLVCHQAWQELMGKHLPSDGSLCELVPDNIDLVVSGDYHIHKHLWLKNKNDHPFLLLSPGSATLQSLKEDPQKYFYALGDNVHEFQSLPLLNRPVEAAEWVAHAQVERELINFLQRAELGDPTSRLPAGLRSPIWNIRLADNLAELVPLIEKTAKAAGAHLFLSPLGQKADAPVAEVGVATFEEALARAVVDDAELRESAVQLWRAADPKQAVAAMVSDLLKNDPPAEEQSCLTLPTS